MSQSGAIKAVAAFEALKGALVLVASSGLLLVHQGLHSFAAQLVEHTHLCVASEFERAMPPNSAIRSGQSRASSRYNRTEFME